MYLFANNIDVEESWDNLTKKCKIILPYKASFKNAYLVNSSADAIFKRGDKINIRCGYFPKLTTIFQGYISQINIDTPVELECEDEMWILKQTTTKKFTGTNIKLTTLLTAILPPTVKFKALDVNVGDWRISDNANVSNVLEELRSKHSIFSQFIDGVLYVGLAVTGTVKQNTEKFVFESQIIDASDLKYQLKEDVKVKIKVNVFYPDNKKVEPIEIGDPEGDLRTINLYNVPQADVVEIAKRELERVKYTGYHGSFLTFGEPYVRPGDIANLYSSVIKDRNGNYLIKSVSRNWGMEGYRQKIELETQV